MIKIIKYLHSKSFIEIFPYYYYRTCINKLNFNKISIKFNISSQISFNFNNLIKIAGD